MSSAIPSKVRPRGVTALSIFFFSATLITIVAALSLLFPNGFLEPIWKLNPRGRADLGAIGLWAVLLFLIVSAACGFSALGLWRGRWWGYCTAIIILLVNLVGDLVNVISGTEPRAAIGIPIVVLIIAYLWRPKIRQFFGSPSRS